MIFDQDLAYMRDEIRAFFDDPISIYSVTITYDEYGQETTTRTLTASVTGQLSNARGNEVQHVAEILSNAPINQGIENVEVMHLTLPYSTSLSITDEITTVDGKNWQVTNINDSQTFVAAKQATIYRHLVGGQEVS